MRDVMTIDQLAEYLQIPKSTLYKLVQDGKVPGKKVGRQWRFHREAVDAWLAQGPDLSGGEGPAGLKQEGQR
ncbi:MAG: helix-turn-helix domain-containing protein [Gammaproteobacteria bacterium]